MWNDIGVMTLGLSPPIVTEFLIELEKRGLKLSRIVVITTKGSRPSYDLLKIAMYWSSKAREVFPDLVDGIQLSDFSTTEIVLKTLTLEDIAKPEDCYTFRSQFDSALNDALKWAGRDLRRVHVCAAGGRKTMPIDAVLVSIAEGINNVYHVIAPRIPGISMEFANLVTGKNKEVRGIDRDEMLSKLSQYAEKPEEAEEDIAKYALEVCFPPKDLDFHLVRIPIPKLPPEERRRFREELRER